MVPFKPLSRYIFSMLVGSSLLLSGCQFLPQVLPKDKHYGFVEDSRPIVAPPFSPPKNIRPLASTNSTSGKNFPYSPGLANPLQAEQRANPKGSKETKDDSSEKPIVSLSSTSSSKEVKEGDSNKSQSSKNETSDSKLKDSKALLEKSTNERLSFSSYCPPFRPERISSVNGSVMGGDDFLNAPPPNPFSQPDFLSDDGSSRHSNSMTVNPDGSISKSSSNETGPIWPPNP